MKTRLNAPLWWLLVSIFSTAVNLFSPVTQAAASSGLACSAAFDAEPAYITLKMTRDNVIHDRADGVHYMDSAERAHHRVRVINGRLCRQDGTLVQLNDDFYSHIYVMDAQGEIYLYDPRFPFEGLLHHSTFLAGGPIAAAGSFFKIIDGIPTTVNDGSGYYAPPSGMLAQLKDSLQKKGVDTSRIRFINYRKMPVEPQMTDLDRQTIFDRNTQVQLEFGISQPEELAQALSHTLSIHLQGPNKKSLTIHQLTEKLWKSHLPAELIESTFLQSPDISLQAAAVRTSGWRRPEEFSNEKWLAVIDWALQSRDAQLTSAALIALPSGLPLFPGQQLTSILLNSALPVFERAQILVQLTDRKDLDQEHVVRQLIQEVSTIPREVPEWDVVSAAQSLEKTLRSLAPGEFPGERRPEIVALLKGISVLIQQRKAAGDDLFSLTRWEASEIQLVPDQPDVGPRSRSTKKKSWTSSWFQN